MIGLFTTGPSCSMQKIALKSREKLSHLVPCEDEGNARRRCQELGETFQANFRTMNGECNNLDNPRNGSKGSRLSRLLPGDHTRVKMPTYFEIPVHEGNFVQL